MKANNHHLMNKEDFQLERIAFFSDAVFAIAMTLLIIEIKVPEPDSPHITDRHLLEYLASTIPKMVGFFISFFVIGLYWASHHRLFGYINKFNSRLLWANLLFLLPIIIMPFSTAFLSEYYQPDLKVPLFVYTVNIIFSGLMSYRLWKMALSPKYKITSLPDNSVVKKYNLVRTLATPAVFMIVLILSFLSGWVYYFALPLMPFTSKFIKMYYRKKYPAEMEGHLG